MGLRSITYLGDFRSVLTQRLSSIILVHRTSLQCLFAALSFLSNVVKASSI
jgi:hypothetical protein